MIKIEVNNKMQGKENNKIKFRERSVKCKNAPYFSYKFADCFINTLFVSI